jgi:kinesin family protein 15
LAGSERQHLTGTTGQRLKEAGNINKSLHSLSHVINALVDITNGRPRHVHYRDSKLTFLLRDSLGGNAKTFIIACVSPSIDCFSESYSTLKFAQRAKMIKNKAILNTEIKGDIIQLQNEVQRLYKIIEEYQSTRGDSEMVVFAVKRQREAEHALDILMKQIKTLEEAVKRKEQQLQSEKMVTKFRESTIKALKGGGEESDLVILLRQEIGELRKQLELHPEVARLTYENVFLKEQVECLREFEAARKEYEEHERRLNDWVLKLKDSEEMEARERQMAELTEENKFLQQE